MNDGWKPIVKLVRGLSHRFDTWSVFSDFVEAAAISLSNAVDLAQRDAREERYLQIVKRYEPDELAAFPQMLGELTNALEDEPADVLGKVFHELELHNKYTGQFFTPYELCRMIASVTLDVEETRKAIAERGFITCQEPAAGSGAMIVALAQAMRDAGFNHQKHLHVTAIDVDAKAVHMCYLQLSLLHVPAMIVHGNTLSLETRGIWYTPAHILGGWNFKLGRHRTKDAASALVSSEPEPVAPSQVEGLPLFAEGEAA